MQKIVLIGCVKTKLKHRAKARDLYISPLFKLRLNYARKIRPDRIYILSAKHGLVQLNQMVRPYDTTLNDMQDKQIKNWGCKVIKALREHHISLVNSKFIILAGNKYEKYITPKLRHYKNPLKGMGLGKQLQFLKKHKR